MRAGTPAILAGVTVGCYNYDPVTPAKPAEGRYVALTLTDAGSRELAGYLGFGAYVVRGRYLGEKEGGLLVSVNSVELVGGQEVSWAGEAVTVGPGAIASVDERRFAATKSVLLVGAGVTALLATTAAFTLTGSGTKPGAAHPPPPKQ